MKKSLLALLISISLNMCYVSLSPEIVLAAPAANLENSDSDRDGITDLRELEIFHTDPNKVDTDGDGYPDGDEVKNGFDPNAPGPSDKLEKHIEVSLKDQNLEYYLGTYKIGEFKISSGVKKTPTPKGTFTIQKKLPSVLYKGVDYYFPNTKWNLWFREGGYYIHGAYWHHNFGKPMSHGCINVSYPNMEQLYKWSDVGTTVHIF